MKIDILTLFPESVMAVLGTSILGRAVKKGAVEIRAVQIRDFTENKQQQVDDYPYGGGWGCVMMAQPLKSCLDEVMVEAGEGRSRVIYMSPQGKPFNQTEARRLVKDYDHLVLVCGHYEGVDERFITSCCDEELSLGDFVLTGGEIPAMAVADCVCRMVPGVLSDPACYEGESHWDGLLEYPQYTRPEVWEGLSVPRVLLNGNHADIEAWRREQQLLRTRAKRPDLFKGFRPETKADRRLLQKISGEEVFRLDSFKAEEADIDDLLSITADGSAYLKACGVDQWQDGFPNADTFRTDMRLGDCWLFSHRGKPAGVFSIYTIPEEDYRQIDGAWLTEGENYATLHRMAVKKEYRGRGVAREMFSLAEDLARGLGKQSLRADTHADNRAMRQLLESVGFQSCGMITLRRSSEHDRLRIGYEKILDL